MGIEQCQSRQFLAATSACRAQSGRDNETEPQGRQHALGECPYIEHDITRFMGTQCRQRAALEAEFTVVVVFDNDCIVPPGEFNQRPAAAC